MISSRRSFMKLAGGGLLVPFMPAVEARQTDLITKEIPKSGEALPVIGLGSWITFNVGRSASALGGVQAVMEAFFAAGGTLVDSSPMYGSAQAAIGHALAAAGSRRTVFAADKVWTRGSLDGVAQITETERRWGVDGFALLQVHNLVDWKTQLETLYAMKAEGRLRYVGITTSHGRRHSEVARILESEPIDFLQLTYNMTHRAAEQRLLPLAREKGIAVIANRPLDGGRLVRRLKRRDVPGEVKNLGFTHWSEFLLKWVVSHPAMTCAIPATSKVPHLQENMHAVRGTLPDDALRARMSRLLEAL